MDASLPVLSLQRHAFVDSTGRSLLLSFPPYVLSLICQHLDTHEAYGLILIGSSALSRNLQQRGGIQAVRIFSESGTFHKLIPPPSLLLSLKGLTEVVIKLLPYQYVVSEWSIAHLPSTLTSLHIEHAYPLLPFIANVLNPVTRTKPQAGDLKTQSEAAYNRALCDDSEWLDTASLLPILKNLTILGEMTLRLNYDAWVAKLPKSSLQSLQVPFYFDEHARASPLVAQSRHAHSPTFYQEVLPPALTNLTVAALPFETHLLLPSRITILELIKESLPTDILRHWYWLIELTCCSLLPSRSESAPTDAGALQFSLLPRGLLKFHLTDEHLGRIGHEDLTHLPLGLKSLSVPVLLSLVPFIAAPLEYLSVRCPAHFFVEDWVTLPRTLHTLRFENWIDLDFAFGADAPIAEAQVPPHLTCLESKYQFKDVWFPRIPSTVTRLAFGKWVVSGMLLPSNTATVDRNALIDSVRNHPYVIKSCIRDYETQDIQSLPESCTTLCNVTIDANAVKYRMLPRGLLALPKMYNVCESTDQHVSELPQSLTSIGITGGLRISSWLALPLTIKTVRRGSVFLAHQDIVDCLELLKTQLGATDGEQTLVIPDDLRTLALSLHATELAERPLIADIIEPLPTVTQWDQRHYTLLPSSITKLIFKLPPYELENPLIQHYPRDTTPFKLPSTLKTLIIGDYKPSFDKNGVIILPSPYRPNIHVKELPTFERCGLLPLCLGPSVTSIEWYGKIDENDLPNLAECTSLTSLTLDYIVQQLYTKNGRAAVDHPKLKRFHRNFPDALQRLHILGTGSVLDWVIKSQVPLPPRINDLKLFTQPSYSRRIAEIQYILRLPLTRLNLNLPSMDIALFPKTITDIKLTQP